MTIGKSILATILFLGFIELVSMVVFLVLYSNDFLFDNVATHATLFLGGLECLIMILFIAKLKGEQVQFHQNQSIEHYIFAALAGVSYFLIQIPLNIIYDWLTGIKREADDLFHHQIEVLDSFSLNSIAVILFIPVAEELFFREYIQSALRKKYSELTSILTSTILFASIHLSLSITSIYLMEFNFHSAYIALFGGLLSAYLYAKSKSIGPSILFHMMWNLGTTIVS